MMRKRVVLAAIVLAVWLPVGSARATNYTAAPAITWLASSLPTSSKVDLAKLAARAAASQARRAPLTAQAPQQILTANIGCQTHLQSATRLPVRHWIEWLDEQFS